MKTIDKPKPTDYIPTQLEPVEDYLANYQSGKSLDRSQTMMRIQSVPQPYVTRKDFTGIKNKNYYSYLRALNKMKKYEVKLQKQINEQKRPTSQTSDIQDVILLTNSKEVKHFRSTFSSGGIK